MLQCLYMTPEIRTALFVWNYRPPPDKIEELNYDLNNVEILSEEFVQKNTNNQTYDPPPTYCIPFQLQLLFARLQSTCRGSVTTTALTKSFHWDSADSFTVLFCFVLRQKQAQFPIDSSKKKETKITKNRNCFVCLGLCMCKQRKRTKP